MYIFPAVNRSAVDPLQMPSGFPGGFRIFYLPICCRTSSAIVAMNSPFVGLPVLPEKAPQKIFSCTSSSPRFHAMSIAWRIEHSTQDGVEENFFATVG